MFGESKVLKMRQKPVVIFTKDDYLRNCLTIQLIVVLMIERDYDAFYIIR